MTQLRNDDVISLGHVGHLNFDKFWRSWNSADVEIIDKSRFQTWTPQMIQQPSLIQYYAIQKNILFRHEKKSSLKPVGLCYEYNYQLNY